MWLESGGDWGTSHLIFCSQRDYCKLFQFGALKNTIGFEFSEHDSLKKTNYSTSIRLL